MKASSPVRSAPTAPRPLTLRGVFFDYLSLTKPEITFLVTISALGGFLLGTPGAVHTATLLGLLAGVALSSSGGAALNLYLEREKDATMRRTDNRPLPAGRIKPVVALLFGLSCAAAGIGLLFLYTNFLTSALSFLSIILYVLLYTPLKQFTKYNTLVGTIPGALPALGGWTAATGSFGAGGWVIFSILLIWQLPHFFSLAWMYRKDYDRAGFQMLPVVEPDGVSTGRQVLICSVLLLIACILPYAIGLSGLVYLIGAVAVSLWMLQTSITFYRSMSNVDARRVLKASVFHIPVLVMLLIFDRLV